MKLLLFALVLSCVVEYISAASLDTHRLDPLFNRLDDAEEPHSRADNDLLKSTANADPSNNKDIPLPSPKDDERRSLVDLINRAIAIFRYNPRPCRQRGFTHQIDDNSFLSTYESPRLGALDGLSHKFGVDSAFRWKRAADNDVSPTYDTNAGGRFRREADPQRGSVIFQGSKPLTGSDRRSTWDLKVNRNILNNGRTTADIYGGVGKLPGQRVQPHIGIQAERRFPNDGFIKGFGEFQPGRGATVGGSAGFRFKREIADDAEEY